MKYFVAVLTLLSMVACGKKEAPIDDRVHALESRPKYKCIEGYLHEHLGGDIWVSKSMKCVVSP